MLLLFHTRRRQDQQEEPVSAEQNNVFICLGTVSFKTQCVTELKISRKISSKFRKVKKKERNSVVSIIKDGGLVSMDTPSFSLFTQYLLDNW